MGVGGGGGGCRLFTKGASLRSSPCLESSVEAAYKRVRTNVGESRNSAILRNLVKKNTKVTPQRGRRCSYPSRCSVLLSLMIRITFKDLCVAGFGWFFLLLNLLWLLSFNCIHLRKHRLYSFRAAKWSPPGAYVCVCVGTCVVHVCSGCFSLSPACFSPSPEVPSAGF